MEIHLSSTRGQSNLGWLQSNFSFSFADYYNPSRMGFGVLRVINDDQIAPGKGFGMHPHRDMEIITIPLKGALKHQDSMGHSTVIKKGEVQIMSAGMGLMHSEFNASMTESVQLLQIWVMPKLLSVKPRYDQKQYLLKENDWTLIVSPRGEDQSVMINQESFFSLGKFKKDKNFSYKKFNKNNGVYLFIIDGSFSLKGKVFNLRDGIGIKEDEIIEIQAILDLEVLVMEIPLLN
jgi:redox-sensitive bicupin YhaK (pirin superfamily)